MLNLKARPRGPALNLIVDGGRVACPRDGDTDLEQCLVCGYLDDVDDGERPRLVRCAYGGGGMDGPVDIFDRAWRARS